MNESGYDQAMLGMALSYYDHAIPLDAWWTDEKRERAHKRAKALAFKGGGHNKFLESIQVWVFIQASRDFWSEFDTYRVGMTKQSSSTMHTLDKRHVNIDDFEEGTSALSIDAFNHALTRYKDAGDDVYKDVTKLKKNLPEGWLQERMVCTNYMVLQNIIHQRTGHRLAHWQTFIREVMRQVEHPYFLREVNL